MRILLVNPVFPDSFWGLNSIRGITGKHYIMPTLALPTLAALTPPRHEVTLVDENVEEIDFDVPCDLVGISCMSVQGPRAFGIAREFRARGKTVAMGGAFPTLSAMTCRPHADVLFLGEAERTWPRFLDEYVRGEWGDTYEEKEKVDIGRAPVPRFDLLKMDRYFVQAVQFSRGCPYECEFCDIIVMLGRRPRTKAVSQLIAEVDEVYRLGGRRIFLVDDNFIGNRKKAKDALVALRDWNAARGFPVMFNTEASLDVADDDELLGLFHDARFIRLFIGVETPRRESLEECRKYPNTKRSLLSQVHKIQSYGLQVTGGMIVGFDHDDDSIFGEQEEFIGAARIPQVMVGMLQAPPGTPLHERLMREGRLRGEFIGDQFLSTNVVPKRMSQAVLMRGYAALLRRLFDHDRYADRAVAYLTADRMHEPIRPKKQPWSEVRAVLRFLFYALFRGDAGQRRFSRRIIAATLRARPGRLPEALYLIVVQRHFSRFVAKCVGTIDEMLARGVDEGKAGSGIPGFREETGMSAAGRG